MEEAVTSTNVDVLHFDFCYRRCQLCLVFWVDILSTGEQCAVTGVLSNSALHSRVTMGPDSSQLRYHTPARIRKDSMSQNVEMRLKLAWDGPSGGKVDRCRRACGERVPRGSRKACDNETDGSSAGDGAKACTITQRCRPRRLERSSVESKHGRKDLWRACRGGGWR
ncbi:hypothetical protein GY45DRAFT_987327 [Cubamyces sp. BRFM 1775]|nr:hypothetical protein GY45DRAFT_987327 [Cubamyces sp. BRFM 1775]